MKHVVEVDWLKDRLKYEPMANGSSLVWLRRNGSQVNAGDIAGTLRKTNGRWEIRFLGKQWQAHRIVWALCYGYFPDCQIDHIDRNPSNNRIENLRLATRNELDNGQNRSLNKNNTTGFTGVIRKYNKFVARIKAAGKWYYGGIYDTAQDAAFAYAKMKKSLHTFAMEEEV